MFDDVSLRVNLEALRDDIAGQMALASPREYAPLAARMQAVLTQLDELPSEPDPDDPYAAIVAKAEGS